MRCVAIALAISLLSTPVSGNGLFSEWGKKCKLTIDAEKVNANLSDFPCLLTEETLPDEMFLADGALEGGGDIRFSQDSAGTRQLACEIVTFTRVGGGDAEVWVKIPSLSDMADTDIYIWYKKADESQPPPDSTYGSESVWDGNYQGVWHLTESTGTRYDSTGNNNHLSEEPTVSRETGQVGYGAHIVDSGYLWITEATQTGLDIFGAQEITISAWIDPVFPDPPAIMYFTSKWDTGNDNRQYGLYVDDSEADGFALSPDGSNFTWVQGYNQLLPGNFYHLAGVSDGIEMRLYKNGVVDLNGQDNPRNYSSGINNGSADVRVGTAFEYGASGYQYRGVIDEVRISDVVRAGDWISTEHNNQSSPITFIEAGTTCDVGYDDCNGIDNDGCEVHTSADVNNCGSCGNRCEEGKVCNDGQCGEEVCDPGMTNCGGKCVILDSSPYHCGTCFNACPSGDKCSAGGCHPDCGPETVEKDGICVAADDDGCGCGRPGINQSWLVFLLVVLLILRGTRRNLSQ